MLRLSTCMLANSMARSCAWRCESSCSPSKFLKIEFIIAETTSFADPRCHLSVGLCRACERRTTDGAVGSEDELQFNSVDVAGAPGPASDASSEVLVEQEADMASAKSSSMRHPSS
mmetsp:Transcript_222/g.427  ORF Transcript_222/g.427 Transcript_222/m.427 type:complete len:116 (-) Transcript_222:64-411(-)